MITDRLEQQIHFLVEVDKLKNVLRQSYLTDGQRRENDAEHSWHFALMAIMLAEYSKAEIDTLRVVKMALIHDLVEIDAGDTFAYDETGNETKEAREELAAERIFNLLPEDLAEEVFGLWREFEAKETPEARFAAALDRFQPILLNYHAGGKTWEKHDISKAQVMERNLHMSDGAPDLWAYAKKLIEQAVEKGYLSTDSIEED
jgi:putative hydrolase of HD superfamily